MLAGYAVGGRGIDGGDRSVASEDDGIRTGARSKKQEKNRRKKEKQKNRKRNNDKRPIDADDGENDTTGYRPKLSDNMIDYVIPGISFINEFISQSKNHERFFFKNFVRRIGDVKDDDDNDDDDNDNRNCVKSRNKKDGESDTCDEDGGRGCLSGVALEHGGVGGDCGVASDINNNNNNGATLTQNLRLCQNENCGKIEPRPKSFLGCSLCRDLQRKFGREKFQKKHYCSIDCANEDWRQNHKQYHANIKRNLKEGRDGE